MASLGVGLGRGAEYQVTTLVSSLPPRLHTVAWRFLPRDLRYELGGSITYERHSEVELALENLKANNIPVGKNWQLVLRYHKNLLNNNNQCSRHLGHPLLTNKVLLHPNNTQATSTQQLVGHTTSLAFMPPGGSVQLGPPTYNEMLQRMRQFGNPPGYSSPQTQQTMHGQQSPIRGKKKNGGRKKNWILVYVDVIIFDVKR